MSTLTTYSTGTVAVTTGGAVTVTGGIWSGTNVVAGDMISVDGGTTILLSDVSDVTHGQIAGWTGGAVSGKTYVVYQDSSLRFDDVQIAQDLQKQVAALNADGYFVFVPSTATAPDPSLGDDGQYAFQPSTGKWWAKNGGLWGVIGSPYGLQPAANLSDVSSLVTAKDNISVWGSDVASTATVNLDAATGDLIDVTGTTTITAITLSSGRERTVRFAGALTLTHGASLILPGAANIVTAAGDFAVFRGYGTATRCVGYSRASGLPVVDGTIIKVQKFTSSGTYTPDSKMRYCVIECVGGGGAGGGVGLGSTKGLGGGGGGSGGYSRTIASAATIGASKTVTVGAAGSGGAYSNGGSGGDASVGTLCIAKGGGGGEMNDFTSGFGGAGNGGVAGTGDVTAPGSAGFIGDAFPSASNYLARGGQGGASHFGGAGRAASTGFSATNGNGGSIGGGGSGGCVLGTTGTAAGGNGGAGFVVITEFCSG